MYAILFVLIVPIIIIGTLFMALFQLAGGKYIAKIENATYGSAYFISVISALITSVIMTLIASISIHRILAIKLEIILLSIVIPMVSLIYVTHVKWKCSDYIVALKASSINIIVSAIFWTIVVSKIVQII